MESTWDLSAAVEEELGRVLRAAGFATGQANRTEATFVRGLEALSFEYLPEDVPRPWIIVRLGRRDGPEESPWFVALWRVYPDVEALQDPSRTAFDSEDSLRSALRLIRDDWMGTYIVPGLGDDLRLRAVRADQEREIAEEHVRLANDQHLRRARACFDEGDFDGAIVQFGIYGPDRLSAADRRRLAIARRSIDGGQR